MSSEHNHDELLVHRRHVLCGGGAAVFSAMIASLVRGAKPVRAETISGEVPEIDSLAARVVTDSYQFAVAPSRKLESIDIQHFGWGIGGGKPPRRTLISEFGLSMHVESRRGADTGLELCFGFGVALFADEEDSEIVQRVSIIGPQAHGALEILQR